MITKLSVGLWVVGFSGWGNTSGSEMSSAMESLMKHWSNLSLNDREGGGVHLGKDRGLTEFILAAKFLTKQALSIDAIIHTYGDLNMGLKFEM